MKNNDIDLQQEWNQLIKKKINTENIKTEDIMNAITQESSTTIFQLKKNLKAKLYWTLFFITCFSTWMLFSLNRPELFALIGILNGLYIIGAIGMAYKFFKMDTNIDYSGDTLTIMRKNYNLIASALKYETVWGVITLPLAIIFGMLVNHQYDNIPLAQSFTDIDFLKKMIILILVLVPITFVVTNKMNESAFGKLKEKLKSNISRLEIMS